MYRAVEEQSAPSATAAPDEGLSIDLGFTDSASVKQRRKSLLHALERRALAVAKTELAVVAVGDREGGGRTALEFAALARPKRRLIPCAGPRAPLTPPSPPTPGSVDR